MDQVEIALAIALALVVGFAGGYAVRSAISARRRRKFQRLRRADALRAIEADKALAVKNEYDRAPVTTTLAPSEAS
jgi:hypothetical protein